jgi:hypothetical protein
MSAATTRTCWATSAGSACLDKAGIARPGAPFFTTDTDAENLAIIAQVCAAENAPLHRLWEGKRWPRSKRSCISHTLDPSADSLLHADYQKCNAALALAVIRHLAPAIDETAVLRAFANATAAGPLLEGGGEHLRRYRSQRRKDRSVVRRDSQAVWRARQNSRRRHLRAARFDQGLQRACRHRPHDHRHQRILQGARPGARARRGQGHRRRYSSAAHLRAAAGAAHRARRSSAATISSFSLVQPT